MLGLHECVALPAETMRELTFLRLRRAQRGGTVQYGYFLEWAGMGS